MATFESVQTGNIHIDEGERKMQNLSPLAKDRLQYQPRYPQCFSNPEKVSLEFYDNTTFKDIDRPILESYFPNTMKFPIMKFAK